MKIAVVGDLDKWGGAAIAATRLSTQFIRNGHDVNRFVVRKIGDEGTTYACGNHSILRKNILRILWHSGYREEHDRLSRYFFSEHLARMVRGFTPEVVNVHNIHAAGLTVALLPRLVPDKRIPLIWTLHDMWAMTGHCAYSYDCDRHTGACDSECPYPDEYPSMKASRIADHFSLRKGVLQQMRNLAFITPSRWLAREAGKGILASHPIFPIPNGIDLGVFSPVAKSLAREAVGLPVDRFILLTGAASLTEKRKGLVYLIRSLQTIPSPERYLLLMFGREPDDSFPRNFPIEVRQAGPVADEGELRLLYSAADAFLLPTLADNLPNVLIESIACGTPCVAFDVGGVSEVVRPGTTGFLARERDPEDLAHRITELSALSPERRSELASICRSVAETDYSSTLQAERYERVFASLIASARETA